jgi:hypothetical protein
MDELEQALQAMGIEWAAVWRLTADRRTGEVIVVVDDGRKFTGQLLVPPPATPPLPRRIKAVKQAA